MRFLSFDEMLSHYAAQTPDACALFYEKNGQKTCCSFSGLLAAVSARSSELAASGKTCLAVLCDGSFSCVIDIFAAAKAGMQVVLLDESLPDAALQMLLPYTDADMLSGDAELCEEFAPYLGGGISGRNAPAHILFFTSGTTEMAKAVVLTEKSLMASAWNGSAILPLSPDDTLLCLLPLGHVFGFVCGLLWGLSCGASVALGRGPRHYADDCSFFAPTALSAVPLLWGFLLKQQALNPELRLVLIGAGDCPQPLLDAAASLGLRVCFGYGLTETSSGVALSTEGDPRAMKICPDDTIRIADDGEILIEAPTCMMQGYYKQPEATGAVLKDGILSTGDLGFLDEEGKLHITGRKKEIIVLPDGTKIFLPEYEQACAAVLGAGDLCIIDDDGVLTLVLGGTETVDAREVLKALSGVLADRPRGQQLRAVLALPSPLPRTATGKIKRWEIAALLEK